MPAKPLTYERWQTYNFICVKVRKPAADGYTTIALKFDDYMQLARRAGGPKKLRGMLQSAARELAPDERRSWAKQLRDHVRGQLTA